MIKTFLARFPEFAENLGDTDREFIYLTLMAAKAELNCRVWGTMFVEGILFLAADKLMCSWLGEPDSMYAIEFERLSHVARQAYFGSAQVACAYGVGL